MERSVARRLAGIVAVSCVGLAGCSASKTTRVSTDGVVAAQSAPGAPAPSPCLPTDSPEMCRQRQEFPPGRPQSSSDVLLTRAQAQTLARQTIGAPNTARAQSAEMPYAEFVTRTHAARDVLIDVNRPIWVVTVHYQFEPAIPRPPIPGGNPQTPVIVQETTIAIDAVSHFVFDIAPGLNAFQR